MFDSNVSRRCFLTGASLAATMPAGGAETVNSRDPIERARGFRVRPQTLERIVAGREAFLAEMNPTKAQIARGLELHFGSFVAVGSKNSADRQKQAILALPKSETS